ncbi:MAG: SPASM domain-containing protein [Butyrivibrio sp.]|uniref:SPASM domain-containing protein n=1 Tax=Pseudobutyrivibrio ruminis TaxID=46206 RepID=A0A927UFX2_9FIRM|nr:radical SAM protein [Butyrivibrio sp.]MBE5840918.1 SPASM domain-containing protein [Butyrivibrio sp.]MBE5921087.1 SPASM domain-containing protein [Pseudobutyrivibrio ruminis]
MKYKNSLFNIYLEKEEYIKKNKPGYISVYNTMSLQFADIPTNCDYDKPPKYLIDNGFIVPNEMDEANEYKKMQTEAITNDFQKKVIITVCTTFMCNYHCAYCFQEGCQGIDIDAETVSSMIRYLKNEIDRNKNLKHLHILWFGGEPLLRFDVIKEISNIIIPYCENKGVKYTSNIVTNGYFMTKDISNELNKLKVSSAQISFDGMESTYNSLRKPPKDAFIRVINNIKESSIPIRIRLNVTREAQDEIFELVKDLNNRGILRDKKNYLYLHRVLEYTNDKRYGFTDGEWLKYREKMKKYLDYLHADEYFGLGRIITTCEIMPKRNITLGADGYLYRCRNHVRSSQYAVGKIADGIDANNIIEKSYITSTMDSNCSNCSILPFCGGGGCRYEELLWGKPCTYKKALFRQNLEFAIKNHESANKIKYHSSLLPSKALK